MPSNTGDRESQDHSRLGFIILGELDLSLLVVLFLLLCINVLTNGRECRFMILEPAPSQKHFHSLSIPRAPPVGL